MRVSFHPVIPYDYQTEIYDLTCEHIRASSDPAFIYASVSAGKTIMMAMLAKRAQTLAEQNGTRPMRILSLARTGELVRQNADEMWNMGVKNSVFSASIGIKSTAFPVIVGTEGTVANALDKELADFVPDILLIDENHQVHYLEPETQYMKIISEMQRRNPKLRIIGYTGSPWRGEDYIEGEFWKKMLYKIDLWDLVKLGFVHEPVFGFGHDDVQYNLEKYDASDSDGTKDYTASQLSDMQKEILESGTTTQKIMLEVIDVMQTRNCALITCAGTAHMKECAKVLTPGSFAMISEKTSFKERERIKSDANKGLIKYVLQIGCWTVGVNIPPLDTIVILRKIGSLTLLTQLIGRGVRKLKSEHEGMKKDDCLVLDYAGTMESVGHKFTDPLLEKAELERGKRSGDMQQCPKCATQNSAFARRCIGEDNSQPDKRCDFFWQSQSCPKCETENDIVARRCRGCGFNLYDHNKPLNGKHYTEAEFKPVLKTDMFPSKCGKGVIIKYELPENEIATEVFWPHSKSGIARKIWYAEFVKKHLHKSWHHKLQTLTTAGAICKQKAMFGFPSKITHRKNAKGNSVINNKIFLDGAEY